MSADIEKISDLKQQGMEEDGYPTEANCDKIDCT